MNSMRWRMLIASFFAILFFLGMAGLVLDQEYQKTLDQNIKKQLRGHIYTLLEATEYNEDGSLFLPHRLSDPLLNRPNSGLYAIVWNPQSTFIWQSGSMLGIQDKFIKIPLSKTGIMEYRQQGHFKLAQFAIIWEEANQSIQYQLNLFLDMQPLIEEAHTFEQRLIILLGGAGLILLIIQVLVLLWGLKPLNRMQKEIQQIEQAEKARLTLDYPQELHLLIKTVNSLLARADQNLQRYRNSLGDLAHSLKTPVAILNGLSETANLAEMQKGLKETLPRIEEIMTYHLKRASFAGERMGKKVVILDVATRIKAALEKVYREKTVQCELFIATDCVFFGDQSDLMEILGNLMDNAWKYGSGKVRISAKQSPKNLILTIENNGNPVALADMSLLIQRGIRLDERNIGQGLGLSLVQDIMDSSKGKLSFDLSELGGLKVILEW